MALNATPNSYSADGNGVTTVFTLPFQIQTAADLHVTAVNIATGVELGPYHVNQDFTLSGIGSANTTLTLTSPLAVGARLKAWRDPVNDQPTSYTPGDPFPAKTHEAALDHLAMQIARLKDRVDRMAYLSDLSTGSALGLPDPVEGSLVGWAGGRWQWLLASGTDLSAALLGTGLSQGDALVTVKQPYTGAVGRTQHQKNAEFLSVDDFGAVGDGVVDDTAAFQNAVSAIPISTGGYSIGHVLLLTAGKKYKVTSTIVIGNRRVSFWSNAVSGSGSPAVIYCPTPNITWFDFTTNNADVISWSNIEFLGEAPGTVMDLGSTLQPCYDSRITNCWFAGMQGECIRGTNLQGCHISNCAFDSGVTHGIRLIKGSSNVMVDNRFYGVTRAGILIEQGENNVVASSFFDFCGYYDTLTNTTAAIVANAQGSNINKSNMVSGCMFRANQIDVSCIGNGGSYGSNTGVNDFFVTSCETDQVVKHFVYLSDCGYPSIVSNKICRPGHTTNQIVVTGSTLGAYISNNSMSVVTAPATNVYVGAATTNTCFGPNNWKFATNPIELVAPATIKGDVEIHGTWTPTIGGNATYSVQEGTWVRVGQLVFVKFKIVINTIGTGSAGTISGLPFASESLPFSSQSSGSVSYFSGIASNVASLTPYVVNGTSTLHFSAVTSIGNTASANVNVFTSGARIDGSLVYSVAP